MKTKKWRLVLQVAMCMAVLAGVAGCTKDRAAAQPVPVAVAPASQAAVEPQGDARALLMRMADFLSKTPRFSVNIREGYDVVQESGQKIEFSETRKLTVSRPDRLRVDVEQSDGDRNMILFDGTTITAFSPTRNVYAQTAKPGGEVAAVAIGAAVVGAVVGNAAAKSSSPPPSTVTAPPPY